MGKMKKLQPRMQTLKDRYKDDKQKFQMEMMALYKKEKVNPAGGCLPILIQIPVFIALYWVLLESVEMRHAPFALWWQDLSAPDPYYVLPILMGLTQFLMMKLNPAPMEDIQKKIMMIMPFALTFIFITFPQGLVLYWVVNNILTMAQQWFNRLSGPLALRIGERLCRKALKPRLAQHVIFQAETGDVIDTGIAIYFSGPKSFTGEDIVELQGHGGPIIQDQLIKEVIAFGARQARAGEFTERAFLNDKIDLAQAEAIADLIDSATVLKQLIYLRMYVEAAIDFPDEEIDFLADDKVRSSIKTFQESLDATIKQAGQGAILRNGFRLVIAGKPNAGKSSLLNALAGRDLAIVTNVPGTTRDIVRETIDIDGLPVHIIDTAGLRDSEDTIEKIGIERARTEIKGADHVLHLVDVTDDQMLSEIECENTTLVYNKVDLQNTANEEVLGISALTGAGIDELREFIKGLAGYAQESETVFIARRRHLSALAKAQEAVERGFTQLELNNAGELLADELSQAQDALNEITGEFTSDDLLGEIFAGFCIGK